MHVILYGIMHHKLLYETFNEAKQSIKQLLPIDM